MTRAVLLAAVLLVAGVGFAGSADRRQPILNRVPKAQTARPDDPPPTRSCPYPPCSFPASLARTPTAFLTWVGQDLATFWRKNLTSALVRWRAPRQLVVATGRKYSSTCYSHGVNSKTGFSYCAKDRPPTIYLPLDAMRARILRQENWKNWKDRDFALAYVVAHEWGHHVQNVLGLLRDRELRAMRIELQADCLAGFWAHSMWARELLEPTDIRDAQALARLYGDAPGSPKNDPRAHGTPDEREQWFNRGYLYGDASRCIVH